MKSGPLVGLGALVVLGSLFTVGRVFGLPAAFLLGAAWVLALVIGLLWASLSELDHERELTFDEALHLAAPTAAEEQKRAVLRALNDLKYELSVGKISQEDFEAGSAHYRAEAKRLIAEADDSLGRGRKRAEELVAERLAASGVLELPLPTSIPTVSTSTSTSDSTSDSTAGNSATSDETSSTSDSTAGDSATSDGTSEKES